MSIIVTNEITIPAERAEMVTQKFAANAKGLEDIDGYQGFQLCQPTEPADDRWLVITHWRDRDAYVAWRDSKKYAESHDGQTHQKQPKDSVVRYYDVAFDTEAE